MRSIAEQSEAEVLHRIYRLVFPHAFAEEAVLWPTMRRVLPDGEMLTLVVEQEHQQINELVTELDGLPVGDPARAALLERVVALLREDVRDEEDALLPRLQEALTVPELRRLGATWEAVRRTSPTRAHPVVARRPPGNTLSALPLSVLDRSRDLLDLGARRSEQLAPALGSASRVVAAGARQVERLPLFRRGERPETSAG
jgi:hypothetical protein